jgi:hypothetical protein
MHNRQRGADGANGDAAPVAAAVTDPEDTLV